MRCIVNNNLDPYINLAIEEYLLRNTEEDIFMLWRSEPSVIIGKHQNAYAEVNYAYLLENNIPFIRRLSGGGTVFHDPGNINFTFIKNGSKGNLVNFEAFTSPMVNLLNSLGVEAKFEGHNDLRVKGLKISGNAEHVFKKRVLHHGTLLYSSKLDKLREAIKVPPDRYEDKAVQSVRSKVTNIENHLKKKLSIEDFIRLAYKQIEKENNNTYYKDLSSEELGAVQKLSQEKYHLWEWNVGYSPAYTLSSSYNGNSYNMKVEKGIIKNIDFKGKEDPLLNNLLNKEHRIESILDSYVNIHKKSPDENTRTELLKIFF